MAEANKGRALRAIMNLTRTLFHKFAHAGTQIHQMDFLAVGKRAILEDLRMNGPQTIPQMARKRPVSRQHILNLVTPLKQEGNVDFMENPVHKRSFLVALTDPGRQLIEHMIAKESAAFIRLAEPLKLKEMNAALETLMALKEILESERFLQIVEEVNQ